MNDLPKVVPPITVSEKARVLTLAEKATPDETVEILVAAGVIEPKHWWQSIGIAGSLAIFSGSMAALATAIAKAVGYEIDVGSTELLISSIVGLFAAFSTWWGRVHASQPISPTVLPKIGS